MTLVDLQTYLRAIGRYDGALDGLYGPKTFTALLQALYEGPDTALTEADLVASAKRLSVPLPCLKAVIQVESASGGFYNGLTVILFEPHVFSVLTGRRYDNSHPTISYRGWGARPYPRLQAERWGQLLLAAGLDVDAAFSAASYGKFQIMGFNYRTCGYARPFDMAMAMSRDEQTQLAGFERLILSRNLDDSLRLRDWKTFARIYNGPGFAEHDYHGKLQRAYLAAGGT